MPLPTSYTQHALKFVDWNFYNRLQWNVLHFHLSYSSAVTLFSRHEWFWMGSLRKNILLILVFLKVPSSVINFSSFLLITFLMILSVIKLCMMIIPLTTLIVSKYLINGNN